MKYTNEIEVSFFGKKSSEILKQISFWLIKGVIFLQKLKISKIWDHQFVAGPMKSLYTKNQLIPTFRLWLLFFSGENVVPKSQRENQKKSPFFGEKSATFQNFLKIIWNLIKHIEIHIWSIFQLNWTFFRQKSSTEFARRKSKKMPFFGKNFFGIW